MPEQKHLHYQAQTAATTTTSLTHFDSYTHTYKHIRTHLHTPNFCAEILDVLVVFTLRNIL